MATIYMSLTSLFTYHRNNVNIPYVFLSIITLIAALFVNGIDRIYM